MFTGIYGVTVGFFSAISMEMGSKTLSKNAKFFMISQAQMKFYLLLTDPDLAVSGALIFSLFLLPTFLRQNENFITLYRSIQTLIIASSYLGRLSFWLSLSMSQIGRGNQICGT